jgi:putative transposase
VQDSQLLQRVLSGEKQAFLSWGDCVEKLWDCGITPPPTDAGETALSAFGEGSSGRKYPAIGQSWRRAWAEVVPFYAFPGDVRRISYTTSAIEALNAKLRRAVRARGHFPSDDAATKLLFLVLNRSEKQWIMPPREWFLAKAQFAVLFGERFTMAMA